MDLSKKKQNIECRIREIDEWLRDLDVAGMTEGGVYYPPDSEEVAQLYHERERLLQELESLQDYAA